MGQSDSPRMGRQKRKTNSPLLKDGGKNPRTAEEEADDVEDGFNSQSEREKDDEVISDLKDFIRSENARNNKSLAEEIRRVNDERMTAIETSLSFVLTSTETLAKRLKAVEQRAQQAEQDFCQCAKKLAEVEEQLDQQQQRELQEWLIFSGPAIPRPARSGRSEDPAQLLHGLIHNHMAYDMDMRQVGELVRDEKQIRVRFKGVGPGSDRFFLVRNKTKLQGSGLYIRERLTPYRQRLFNEVLQLKRQNRVSTVFTREGIVFVATSQRDRPRPVRSDVGLERLMQHLAEHAADQQTGVPAHQSTRATSGAAVAPSTLSQRRNSPRVADTQEGNPADSSESVVQRRSPQLCTSGGVGENVERQQPGSADRGGSRPAPAPGDQQSPDASRPAVSDAASMDWRPTTQGGEDGFAGGGSVGDGGRTGGRGGVGEITGDDGPTGSGSGDGGDSRPAGPSQPDRSKLPTERRRSEPAAAATGAGTRRRYGGDIRKYGTGLTAHSKYD